MTNFQRIDEILKANAGVEFTGAVARIEHRGKLVFEGAYGVTRADELARPVFCDTRFDLASLTKLFVATLALHTVAEEKLEIDEPLVRVIPEWRGKTHAAITLRMLLAHNSGMDSGADYRTILNDNVEHFALNAPLLAKPGERVIYSDLGFIALGVVLQRAMGESLPALIRKTFSPALAYRPRSAERLNVPATEDDGWRGRVQGHVHDEKAYLMGGAAGHAGLFGTAADVAALTEIYLDAHREVMAGAHEPRTIPAGLALDAITEQAYDPVLRRGLGWALKTNDENSCGRYMDRSSFGHTGFVGTCVWADPTRDLQGVLLTNAVYFGRNTAIATERPLRQRFYETLVACLPSD
jgi:CubicO group peptidase (beta-lactamase class C family)